MTGETNHTTGNSTSSVSSPAYRDKLQAQVELLDEISLKLDEYFLLKRFSENNNEYR
jgi:hypothetical protein